MKEQRGGQGEQKQEWKKGKSPEILIVGEAFGQQEEKIEFPFVGSAGFELMRMLRDAGFGDLDPPPHRPGQLKMRRIWQDSSFALSNVFMQHPEGNDVEKFFGSRMDDVDRSFGRYKGKYLLAEYRGEIERLRKEVAEFPGNLVIAVGATAAWAILGLDQISEIRGTVFEAFGKKVLPTYHPAAVLRDWKLRPIAVMDLFKAKHESRRKGIHRIPREIWVSPTIEDLYSWWDQIGSRARFLSIDIETIKKKQISEIGISAEEYSALHVPFIIQGRKPKFRSYWASEAEELKVWEFLRMVLESPIPKIGQNFQYDLIWIWRMLGIRARNYCGDTMILHHALYPGMPKSLGFLGSIYCNEPAWKQYRKQDGKDEDE